MSPRSRAFSALVLFGGLACNPAQAVQHVFVASYGNDANTSTNCGFANPCRGFTAAMTVVDAGGVVVALDAAGYGAITITKSVTITANPGFYAVISAADGPAVTIATAGVQVTLRGLNIIGSGGSSGVYMTNGSRLSIENCVISNFWNYGVLVDNTAAIVRIVNSMIRDNGGAVGLRNGPTATIVGTKFLGNSNGVIALADAPGATLTAAISDSTFAGGYVAIDARATAAPSTVRVSVDRSTLSNNDYGAIVFGAGTGIGVLTLSNNMITGNANAGLTQMSDGILESLGNNTVRQNGANIGTITTVSPQ